MPGYATPGLSQAATIPSGIPGFTDVLKNDPEFAFSRFLQDLGLLGSDVKSRYARGSQPRYQQQWEADIVGDPTVSNITYYDWLTGHANPGNDFAGLTPFERGYSSRTMQPRTRWVL